MSNAKRNEERLALHGSHDLKKTSKRINHHFYKSETKVSEGSLASEKGLISALAESHKSNSDL